MPDSAVQARSFQYGSRTIAYTLEYAARKTLGIRVNPDMSVQVTAPLDTAEERLAEKLRKKAPWIIKQQDFFYTFHPKTPPRKYVGGESHYYLGRKYRLKLTTSEDKQVKLYRGFIEVYTPDPSNKKVIQQQMEQWYRGLATIKFQQYLDNSLSMFRSLNIPYSSLHIRKMKKRWGSCTPDGKIILNLELIQAPRGCIEYVIAHELCHLVHPNHSRKFYNLLEAKFPDWHVWKGKLELVLA